MQAEDWEDPDRQNQDAYDELLAAIEASENQLSLLIAVCNDPGLQEEIIQRYETDLSPTFHHDRLTLARGEPSLKAAINQAIAEDEALQQDGKAVLTLTGIEQLHFLRFGEDKSEQDVFFGYLQWTREALREFQFPIVIWVTYQILAQLSRKSPDFWSWRRGVFRFVSRKTIAVPVRDLDAIRQELEPMLSGLDEDALIPIDDLKVLIQN